MRGVNARERAGGQGGLWLVASTVFAIATALGWPQAASAAVPLSGATQVAVGGSHACAVAGSGTLYCWGAPTSALGRVGAGHAAAPVQGLESAIAQVTAGDVHACAVTAYPARLLCWGENSYGQLGGDGLGRREPAFVPGLPGPVQHAAAGDAHTCAVVNGAAWCWGSNNQGQLGLGTQSWNEKPQSLQELSAGVAAISAGNRFTCSVHAGAAKCWGSGTSGQIGDGTAQNRSAPTQVATLTAGVTDVSAGYLHACAVVSGAAKCWGDGSTGQLGNGVLAQRNVPVDVIGAPSGIVSIAAGLSHSCAVRNDGVVLCWGDNSQGQLGDGTRSTRAVAGPVTGLAAPAIAVSVGPSSTCVVLAGREVRCFGSNGHYMLGTGGAWLQTIPADVAGLPAPVTTIAAGWLATCALAGGRAYCVGDNGRGQLGDGTRESRGTAQPVPFASDVRAVDMHSTHACGVVASGGIGCWGAGEWGQLGNGTAADSSVAVSVVGLPGGANRVATGERHTCALSMDGTVHCWGQGASGELGNGFTSSSLTPVQVLGLSGIARIDAGNGFSCALHTNGALSCWGSNQAGTLGDGSSAQRAYPVEVFGIGRNARALSAGEFHACAVLASGEVRCWGSNSRGQLAESPHQASWRSRPVPVLGLAGPAIDVAAGYEHSCAVVQGGIVQCWGSNAAKQLGPGLTSSWDHSVVPVTVPVGEPAVAVSAGVTHSCALTASGRAVCWGGSESGETGNRHVKSSSLPVPVMAGDFGTTTTLSANPESTTVGDWVDLVATVAATELWPEGAVTFHDGTAPILECVGVSLQSGIATCRVALTRGTHTLHASFLGSDSLLGSTASIVHVVNPLEGSRCGGFFDLDASEPLCTSVEWVRNRSVTLGCEPGFFCPASPVTRLSMAAFLNRLGRVLTPQINAAHNSGILSASSLRYYCRLYTPVADYARRVYLDAVLSARAAPDLELELTFADDLGTPLASVPPQRLSLVDDKVVGTRISAIVDIPAGAQATHSLFATTLSTGSDTLYDATCSLRSMTFSRDAPHAPFDVAP